MRWAGSIIMVLAIGMPSLVLAQEPTFKISGLIKQFDLERGTITVRPTLKGVTEDQTYSFLKKDVEVTGPKGQKALLNMLAVGQTIQLKIGVSGDVEGVIIETPAFLATIADVDPKNRTIKVARPENQSATFAVPADAKILLAGRSAFLREITPGSEMKVSTSLDSKTILELSLVSHPDGKLATKLYPRVKVSKLPGTRYVGVITDIDPIKNELQLTGPKTKFMPRTFSVAKDVTIQSLFAQVPIQRARLNQVPKMASATVLASADNQVTNIIVDPPTAFAKMKKLNDAAGTLTVEVRDAEKTFAIRSDLKVMNGTRVLRLTDLEANAPVNLVLSLDREQLLAVDLRPALAQR